MTNSTDLDLDFSRKAMEDLLWNDHSPQDWLIDGVLPHPTVGVLAAPGGTGKSYALLQLALSFALNTPWLGMPPSKPRKTLILSAEDDKRNIQRRLHNLIECHKKDHRTSESADIDERVIDNVKIESLIGKRLRFTKSILGRAVPSGVAETLIQKIESSEFNPDVIIFDPLSHFDGGEPNSNADASFLIGEFEKIGRRIGATILIAHHVRKHAQDEGTRSTTALRGASAFVDSVRWVGLMTQEPPSQIKKRNLDPQKWNAVISLKVVKSNYGRTGLEKVIARSETGLLFDVESINRSSGIPQETLNLIKEKVSKAANEGDHLTKSSFRSLSGSDGPFNLGDQQLRKYVTLAIEKGEILAEKIQNRTYLYPGHDDSQTANAEAGIRAV